MPNRLFYTTKLKSSVIYNAKCNFSRSFYDLLKHNQIISLADSQMLKSIREITNHKVDLEILEEWYSERDRLKRMANSESNKKRIWELQNNIYTMMYIPEYITVVIQNNKHYERFFKKGFIFNGEKYTRFSCSASQARVNTVVFIKDSIKQEMKKRLNNNGMVFDEEGKSVKEFAPSKYNAYFGLNSSAIKVVRSPRFCIIPDFNELDKVEVDYVTETDENSDDIIDRRTIDVEFNRFDGNGLISPEYAKYWSEDIGIYNSDTGEGYIACQFCIRYNFTKGMLNTFDYLLWCKEKNNGSYLITDIYGKTIDLRNVDVILTEGQTKIWNAWDSQEEYEKNCNENHLVWGVTRYTPEEDDKILITNYQFLQTLNLTDEDIKQLCSETVEYIKGVSYDDYWYTLLFMLGEKMTDEKIVNYMKSSDNYWLKSLICNPNLLQDKYSKEKIRDSINRRIEQACIGKIMVRGNFQVIIPDSYAFMEWCCYRDPLRVKGLLGAGECYSKFWTDRDKKQILSQRSPLTHFSECHLMNVKNNEEIQKWFKYSYTGFYTNVHDDSVMCWAGADQVEVPSYRNIC